MELVRKLIEKHKVAVMPGNTFGIECGCHLRVSYGALSPQTAIDGIGRLVEGLARL